MSLVHNERTKLTATYLNGVAITIAAAGVITPLVALSYGLQSPMQNQIALLITVGWFSSGIGLHLLARTTLGRLRS